jgi:hypothetical protein
MVLWERAARLRTFATAIEATIGDGKVAVPHTLRLIM